MLCLTPLRVGRAEHGQDACCANHVFLSAHKQVEELPVQGKTIDAVDELEIQYYEIQLELYEVKLEILRSEETILVTRLDSVKRLIKGNIHIYVRMKCRVTCLRTCRSIINFVL